MFEQKKIDYLRKLAVTSERSAIYFGGPIYDAITEIPTHILNELLDELEQQKWTPIDSEDLPEIGESYLVIRKNTMDTSILHYGPNENEENVFYCWDQDWDMYEVNDVTYWMPLPCPPVEIEG